MNAPNVKEIGVFAADGEMVLPAKLHWKCGIYAVTRLDVDELNPNAYTVTVWSFESSHSKSIGGGNEYTLRAACKLARWFNDHPVWGTWNGGDPEHVRSAMKEGALACDAISVGRDPRDVFTLSRKAGAR